MEAKRQADAAARKLEEEQMAAQKLSEAEAMRQKKASSILRPGLKIFFVCEYR